MQMTHTQARELIQFSLDRALEPAEKTELQAHLRGCLECQGFSDELAKVGALLVPAMKKHWAVTPVPLSIPGLMEKRKAFWRSGTILTIRTAFVSMMLAVFVFSAWQFTRSNSQPLTQPPAGVLPVPTPSGQSTSTQVNFQSCKQTLYRVQPSDTLQGLAERFSTTKEKIRMLNKMQSDDLFPDQEILVPACASTPTTTHSPSTLTTTFTPLFNRITSTPGG